MAGQNFYQMLTGIKDTIVENRINAEAKDLLGQYAQQSTVTQPVAMSNGGSNAPDAIPQGKAPTVQMASLGGGSLPDMTRAQNATASIESGGRYDALGPVTKTGDRAYGKYQIMGANIPEWSKEVLGQPVSVSQFLADPKLQDTIYNAKFGQYMQKYGPEGAARAWFAGEGGMNDPNRKDQLGTSVSDYGQRFAQAYGGAGQSQQGAPVQLAQAMPSGQSGPMYSPELVQRMLQNPRTRELGQKILMQQQSAAQKAYSAPTRDAMGNYVQYGPGGEVKVITSAKDLDPRTAAITEFEYARRQGYGGTFSQYQVDKAKAGATSVNVDTKAEGAFQTEAAKGQAKLFNTIVEEATKSQENLGQLAQLRELSGDIGTGLPAAWQGYLAEKGIKIGDNVGKVEAFTSLIDKLTPQQRVPGAGATSDFDAKLMKSSLPSLIRSPEGNAIIMDTFEGLERYRLARADIATKVLVGEMSQKDGLKAIRDLPDPYTGLKAWKKAQGEGQGKAPQATEKRTDAPRRPPEGMTAAQTFSAARDAYREAMKNGNTAAQKAIRERLDSFGIDPKRLDSE